MNEALQQKGTETLDAARRVISQEPVLNPNAVVAALTNHHLRLLALEQQEIRSQEMQPSSPVIETPEAGQSTRLTFSEQYYLVRALNGALEFTATVTFPEPNSTPVLGPLPSLLRYNNLLLLTRGASELLSQCGSEPSSPKESAPTQAPDGPSVDTPGREPTRRPVIHG